MAITPGSYFNALRDYLNTKHYAVTEMENDKIVIKDKVYLPGATEARFKKIRLNVPGEALVINLDKKIGGNSKPLFHFLDDEAKPWAKRCDFVIFHLHRNQIAAICIEFKSNSFPDSLTDQMNAGAAWCRSLHSVIKHYTGITRRMCITKFVLSCHQSPDAYLDDENKYLRRDHTIRHYLYDEVDGMSLDELENMHVETIG